MKKQALFSLFIALAIGIFAQDKISIPLFGVISIFVFSVLILVVALLVRKLRGISLLLFFVAIGFIAQFLNSKKDFSSTFKGSQNIAFKVDKKLNSNEKSRRYIVEVTSIKENREFIFPFLAVINVPKNLPILDFEHRYFTTAYVNQIKAPTQDYQFDYQKYMNRQNVGYQIFLRDTILSQKIPLTLTNWPKEKRLEILRKIDASGISDKARDFLKGIILADRTDMDLGVSQDFTRSGLSHFLAISGTHMVIIFWFLMSLLQIVFPVKYCKVSTVLCLACIWAFAVFIDYGSSVVRSCLMLTIYYIMVLLQRKPDLLHSIGLSGLLILIFDPQQLFDVGFQLSFLAVIGIYWLNMPVFNLFPKHKNNTQKALKTVVSITLAAQIITLPLILYYFHQFSFVSIVSNLVIVPLSEIVIVYSLLMTVVIGFIGNFTILNLIYDYSISLLLKLIHFFADIDTLFFDKIPFHGLEVIFLFVVIYFLRYVLQEKNYRRIWQFELAVIAFLLVRLGLNYFSFQKEEVMVHEVFKDRVFSTMEKGELVFYMPEKLDSTKMDKSIMKPYAISRRIKKYKIQRIDDGQIDEIKWKGIAINVK